MNGINPQTGKRMGKFLWRENPADQEEYLKKLKEQISSGYYSSDKVIASIVDDLAPLMSETVDVEAIM